MLISKTIHSQRGFSLVEGVWLWPVLLLLTLGCVQLGFLYKARATLNSATFEAARTGSINNADRAKMRDRLARAMAPLYVKSEPDVFRLNAERARLALLSSTPGVRWGDIEVISPAPEIYQTFEKTQYTIVNGREEQVDQMPNDNLRARNQDTESVSVGGDNININLQDANILKIKGHWCYELQVPFVNKIFYEFYSNIGSVSHPHWVDCRAISATTGDYYIPVSAQSVVRMQSAIRW